MSDRTIRSTTSWDTESRLEGPGTDPLPERTWTRIPGLYLVQVFRDVTFSTADVQSQREGPGDRTCLSS